MVDTMSSWPRQHSILPLELSLANWMLTQRKARRSGSLDNDRVLALETLPGWSWAPLVEKWGDIFSRLQVWVAEHVGMPQRGADDTVEVSLAQWVNKQRIAKNSGVLVADRVHALETLPDWSWTPQADEWSDVLSRLKTWIEENGMPKRNSFNSVEAELAKWVDNQRSARMKKQSF